MGVLEDVVVGAKSAAETVSREAGRLVDISKLKFTASDIQKEIARRNEVLGKMVYDSRTNGASPNQNIDEEIHAIDELKKKLDEINATINALTNKSVCPSCGYKNEDKAAFCSRCGTKLHSGTEKAASAPAAGQPVSKAPEAPKAPKAPEAPETKKTAPSDEDDDQPMITMFPDDD